MMITCGVGRLTRDPELKYVKNGETCLCEFSLAVNEYRKVNGERKKFPHFFDFIIWDKAAELIAEYCKKGDELQVKATPRLDKWEDQEGNKRSRVMFRVDDFEFGRKARRNEDGYVEETNSENEVQAEEPAEVTPF